MLVESVLYLLHAAIAVEIVAVEGPCLVDRFCSWAALGAPDATL